MLNAMVKSISDLMTKIGKFTKGPCTFQRIWQLHGIGGILIKKVMNKYIFCNSVIHDNPFVTDYVYYSKLILSLVRHIDSASLPYMTII